MLASDSDSDYEYRDGGNSVASEDMALMGKLALGVDPNEMKGYDGKSTPTNGSQYLLKVMAEKKVVPKVVYADTSKLPVSPQQVVSKAKESELINPNYLERFLRMCSAYEEEKGNMGTANMKLLPSSRWREESIYNFSITRSNVDRWRYRIEAGVVALNRSIKTPQNNDPFHWQKFCFGQPFIQFAAVQKWKLAEEKLNDFFLNLYSGSTIIGDKRENLTGSVSNVPVQVEISPAVDGAVESEVISSRDNANHDVDVQTDDGDISEDEEEPENGNTSFTKSTIPVVQDAIRLGHRPQMSVILPLSQSELENLVKYNLLWLKTIGFVNECQGQWLYAILACLAKPIEPSVMSDLRSIARFLIQLRNSISDWNSHLSSGENHTDEAVSNEIESSVADEKVFDFINTLNLFIYIIADYFQQKDLIMNV